MSEQERERESEMLHGVLEADWQSRQEEALARHRASRGLRPREAVQEARRPVLRLLMGGRT